MRDHQDQMETMDPVYFLRQYTGGEPVSKQLAQLVYELKERYSFSNGVINILFEYCILENNYKINRIQVLKLAEQLFQNEIRTGKEAFHYLKHLKKEKQKPSPSHSSRTLNPQNQEYNMEYVETNIALLARQLHDLRKEIKNRFLKMDQQLSRIESRLERLTELMK